MVHCVLRRSSRLILCLSLSFVLLISGDLFAQPKGITPSGTTKPDDNTFEIRQPTGTSSDATSSRLTPLDRAVDASSYRLGPNDVLGLTLPLFSDLPIQINVSPENTVVLPRGAGLIDVSHMTLMDLRKSVDSIYKKRASLVSKGVSLSLIKPRSIYITVSGDVFNPGRFILTAADRVTTALDIANKLPEDLPEQLRLEVATRRMTMSGSGGTSETPGTHSAMTWIRKIMIRHNDGSVEYADLVRYKAFGNTIDNPTLREGDEIIIRRTDPTGLTVSIAGAVNNPTTIPYRSGDNAWLMMRLCAGLQEEADPKNIVLVRQSPTGVVSIPVNGDDSTSMQSQMLNPGDRILIGSMPALAHIPQVGTVRIIGEVTQPSYYPIVPGVTKLSEIIHTAGGFTTDAAINGATIRRAPDPRMPGYGSTLAQIKKEFSTSSLQWEDTARYYYDFEVQQNLVSVDFVALFDNHDSKADIVLQNGDQIFIPRNPHQVFVQGRVLRPGWTDYKAGNTLEQYIAAVGGFTEAADKKRVEVKRYGTRVWVSGESAVIMPGDVVNVPGELPSPVRTPLESANTIVSLSSASLSFVNLIYDIIRKITTNP